MFNKKIVKVIYSLLILFLFMITFDVGAEGITCVYVDLKSNDVIENKTNVFSFSTVNGDIMINFYGSKQNLFSNNLANENMYIYADPRNSEFNNLKTCPSVVYYACNNGITKFDDKTGCQVSLKDFVDKSNKLYDSYGTWTLRTTTGVGEYVPTNKYDDPTLLAIYVNVMNTGQKILIKSVSVFASGASYEATLNGNLINIANINNYSEGNYPKYIVPNGNGVYSFAETLEDVPKNQREKVYIDQKYLLNSDLSESEKNATCNDLFGDNFLTFLNDNVFKVIYIAVPIILIVMTSLDFAKVVFVDDKEGIQKAFKNFGKRAIVAVLIFLIPRIIILIAGLLGADQVSECSKALTKIQNSETTSN